MGKYTYLLTLSGTLPFFVLTFILLKQKESLEWMNHSFDLLFNIYSISIISFISGIHWSQHLKVRDISKFFMLNNIPIFSNANVIIALLVWIFLDQKKCLFVHFLIFIVLLIIDAHFFKIKIITFDYFKLRIIATSIVLVNFIALLFDYWVF